MMSSISSLLYIYVPSDHFYCLCAYIYVCLVGFHLFAWLPDCLDVICCTMYFVGFALCLWACRLLSRSPAASHFRLVYPCSIASSHICIHSLSICISIRTYNSSKPMMRSLELCLTRGTSDEPIRYTRNLWRPVMSLFALSLSVSEYAQHLVGC